MPYLFKKEGKICQRDTSQLNLLRDWWEEIERATERETERDRESLLGMVVKHILIGQAWKKMGGGKSLHPPGSALKCKHTPLTSDSLPWGELIFGHGLILFVSNSHTFGEFANFLCFFPHHWWVRYFVFTLLSSNFHAIDEFASLPLPSPVHFPSPPPSICPSPLTDGPFPPPHLIALELYINMYYSMYVYVRMYIMLSDVYCWSLTIYRQI